jgi:hypothetical protein
MSRIILSTYEDGQEHVVVGYDRPLQTYYWQEFAKEYDDNGMAMWATDEEWEEMIGFAGYMPRELPEISDLFAHAATTNKTVYDAMMAADETMLVRTLERHKTLVYPDSNVTIDLSTKE